MDIGSYARRETMVVLGLALSPGLPLVLLTLLSLVLLAYHHFGYPLILAVAARLGRPAPAPLPRPDDRLPPITVVVPAYNEAAVITAKLENLAALDYPAERVTVIVASDGSTDGTVQLATLAAARLGGPRIEVRAFAFNRGKIAVLNDVLAGIREGLVCLTDASALLSPDALRLAAAHFADPGMGVVAGTYRFATEGTAGEAAYWRYQVKLKYQESLLGGVIGVHGAGYFYRADLFEPLAPDTINDDFILPMRIVARGFRVVYETRIITTELEVATLATDHRRRRRIAAGNMQQLLRLAPLLLPRHGAVAFCFLSGKALRALSPFLMVAALGGSAWLAATGSTLFAWLLGLQLAGYALAVPKALAPRRAWPKPLELAHYLVAGHVIALAGGCLFLLGLEKGRWHRAGIDAVNPAMAGGVDTAAAGAAIRRLSTARVPTANPLGNNPNTLVGNTLVMDGGGLDADSSAAFDVPAGAPAPPCARLSRSAPITPVNGVATFTDHCAGEEGAE